MTPVLVRHQVTPAVMMSTAHSPPQHMCLPAALSGVGSVRSARACKAVEPSSSLLLLRDAPTPTVSCECESC
ncbi:hypothetical protein CBOM_07718 [Ceraceosorus bombacis]|uniref:Uncharacterized protein n=1 Tax=Ceraceosorus bombacis TaxID=401625 RepID=A0A0P1BGN9_9BASI|nr:hypothetical protein CBOM_07718 [Ceraceosorus bombacis]